MEAVIFTGVQGSGKSTFCRQRFFDTHVRINLDMLRTRRRENILLQACIVARQPFVVDNTNPRATDRMRYIAPAKAANFRVVAYHFDSPIEDCLRRNEQRRGKAVIPLPGVFGTANALEPPAWEEGFDAIFTVRIGADGQFLVEARS